MLRITRYVVYDLLRNKVSLAYTLFLFVVSVSLFRMEENGGKAVISLLNIVLIVIPLISIVFATIQWYNSYEFVELMLTQPVGRTRVLLSEYAGIGGALSLAFLLGVGIPVLLFQCTAAGLSMLLMGVLLTCAFTSIAFFASIRSRDKARGIGVALMLWFYFALIYDGLVLLLLFAFSDYPLERLTMLLCALNPIDLARIFIMLQIDISALMGYTGAVYKDFFGSAAGIAFTAGILLLWILLPLWGAVRHFRKRDL